MADAASQQLVRTIAEHPGLTVLTGAGCSTASGIPDYRDDDGLWKHTKPVQFADFLASPATRQRYWARSYVGWPRIATARPNRTHRALAALEQRGYVRQLITQNVDELHGRGGSRRVENLHGVLSRVRCLDCKSVIERADLQRELARRNPRWTVTPSASAPDGDAHIPAAAAREFDIPDCNSCGGLLKPDVVFFGENVPRQRVERCTASLRESAALLVVGSSLMVFSGFRFARLAHQIGIPLFIVNRGRTRADELADARFAGDCGDLLSEVAAELAA